MLQVGRLHESASRLDLPCHAAVHALQGPCRGGALRSILLQLHCDEAVQRLGHPGGITRFAEHQRALRELNVAKERFLSKVLSIFWDACHVRRRRRDTGTTNPNASTMAALD